MNDTNIKTVYCAGCGKDISIKPYTLVSKIFRADDGKDYCQRCYKKIERQINNEQKKSLKDNAIEKLIKTEPIQDPKQEPETKETKPIELPSEPIQAPKQEPETKETKPVELPQRADYADYIQYCLAYSITVGASDLHIKANSNPVIRIYGEITEICDEKMLSEQITEFILSNYGKSAEYLSECVGAVDFAFTYMNVRFRCNAYRDMHGWCVALRLLTIVTAEFKELGIPEILKTLATKRSGMILITGPTGSGKTTTLSCLVDYLNRNQSSHIIMLEDPIEFVHSNKKCIISQREIGRDTSSYSQAIVEAMREDPDIILVGEMRDRDSIEAALRAAETGHLVLSTLHTKGAGSTIDRVIDIFPPEQQNQIRTQLALSLIGVVSQQLIPGVVRGKRWLASEVMINTQPIQNIIRQGKTHLIASTLQISKQDGMYTMKSSIDELLANGKITGESADMYRI